MAHSNQKKYGIDDIHKSTLLWVEKNNVKDKLNILILINFNM